MKSEKDLKKWMMEAGHETPSPQFVDNMMDRIMEVESIKLQPYQPVIAPWVMKMIIGGVVALCAYILYSSGGVDQNVSTGSEGLVFLSNVLSYLDFSNQSFYTTEINSSGWNPIYGYTLAAFAIAVFYIGRREASVSISTHS